ncbi:hypothetical protein GO730_21725 [Spirosoma sp. HMF3257]|uniref:Lipoprotein n=1 Tax=Spirosoma telluris TaxID=2183553 RepID=A0A327NQ51_9BACT|nr:hypothetical protein [Spirosoma telluris]RAI76136.1 hypothetical protein HMF3257_21645 [Spirosoma telluris]
MRQVLTSLGLLILMLGCKKDAGVEPGEVEATLTGYVIADYWSKGCSTGGLAIKVGNASYVINNSLSSEYEQANSWPIGVWVRYESAPPDNCGQWTNRINILSIRKKQ